MTTSLLTPIILLAQFVLSIIFISFSCFKKKAPPPEVKPAAAAAAVGADAPQKSMVKTAVLNADSKDSAPAPAAPAAAAAAENKDAKAEEKKEEKKEEAAPAKADEKKDEKGTPSKDAKDEPKKEEKKEEGAKAGEADVSNKNKPYPEVKEPTKSEIQRKKDAMEKEKKEKINKGQYQSRSDEDDTLEKVKSLNEEQTEKSVKKKNK